MVFEKFYFIQMCTAHTVINENNFELSLIRGRVDLCSITFHALFILYIQLDPFPFCNIRMAPCEMRLGYEEFEVCYELACWDFPPLFSLTCSEEFERGPFLFVVLALGLQTFCVVWGPFALWWSTIFMISYYMPGTVPRHLRERDM